MDPSILDENMLDSKFLIGSLIFRILDLFFSWMELCGMIRKVSNLYNEVESMVLYDMKGLGGFLLWRLDFPFVFLIGSLFFFSTHVW